MKPLIIILLFLGTAKAWSQTKDTIAVSAKDLNMSFVPEGHLTYLVYTKKPKEHAAEKLVKVNIDVRKEMYQQKIASLLISFGKLIPLPIQRTQY